MNAYHLAVFCADIAFDDHLMVNYQHPPCYPVGVLVELTTPVRIYLK